MTTRDRPSVSNPYVIMRDESAFKEVRPGFRRRIITGNDIMLCFWRIEEGRGPTPYDNHPDNEQFGIILAGKLDFRIDSDERDTLEPGDVYWAPKGTDHGDSLFIGDPEHGEVWILDLFVPPREDYRE
jgi:mannose-6-phosphate isomerase-like protein (cupin superfamily)